MELININGLSLGYPTIKSYKVIYEKLDGSGTKRNIYGNMRRQVIANKLKIEADTVDGLTEDEVIPILNEITKDTFSPLIFNPKLNNMQHINCYSSVPEIEFEYLDNGKKKYKSFKIGLIEL